MFYLTFTWLVALIAVRYLNEVEILLLIPRCGFKFLLFNVQSLQQPRDSTVHIQFLIACPLAPLSYSTTLASSSSSSSSSRFLKLFFLSSFIPSYILFFSCTFSHMISHHVYPFACIFIFSYTAIPFQFFSQLCV
jgi:hypothetical protein